jgi:hypothetical protein
MSKNEQECTGWACDRECNAGCHANTRQRSRCQRRGVLRAVGNHKRGLANRKRLARDGSPAIAKWQNMQIDSVVVESKFKKSEMRSMVIQTSKQQINHSMLANESNGQCLKTDESWYQHTNRPAAAPRHWPQRRTAAATRYNAGPRIFARVRPHP